MSDTYILGWGQQYVHRISQMVSGVGQFYAKITTFAGVSSIFLHPIAPQAALISVLSDFMDQ